jgi:phage recombination protein Bet
MLFQYPKSGPIHCLDSPVTEEFSMSVNPIVPHQGYTEDQVSLLSRTIAKGTTPDELALFVAQCRRTGLDPFSQQIYAIKRWDARERREVMVIQVGIAGYQLIAERTGQLDGIEGPFFAGLDEEWKEVWTQEGPPFAAKVVVHRKDRKLPTVAIVYWDEYSQKTKDGNLTKFWREMPKNQLGKCAMAKALRQAFAQELASFANAEDYRDPAEVIEEQPQQSPQRQQIKARPVQERAAAPLPDEIPAHVLALHDARQKLFATLGAAATREARASLWAETLAGHGMTTAANMSEEETLKLASEILEEIAAWTRDKESTAPSPTPAAPPPAEKKPDPGRKASKKLLMLLRGQQQQLDWTDMTLDEFVQTETEGRANTVAELTDADAHKISQLLACEIETANKEEMAADEHAEQARKENW